MAVTPDQELSTIDKGDDMQRRLRYQAKYAAWKSIAMLDSNSEIESLYCEHHEDLLVELKRGGFVGTQVKTRELSLAPFTAGDQKILKSVARFIELDVQFPGSFRGFVIASNHGFVREQKPRSLQFLIDKAVNDSEGAATELESYIRKLNKDQSSSFSADQLKRVLMKLTLESELPQFPDFEMIIAELIGARPEYVHASPAQLKTAVTVLVNKISSMSSLEVPRFVETVFKSNPSRYEAERLIASKRLTPHMVLASLKSSVIPTDIDAPSSLEAQAKPADISAQAIEEIKESFKKHSRRLLDWPTTLDGSTRLESTSLSVLKSTIESQDTSVQILLGPPGSGKSALLAVFARDAILANEVVLAVKADQMLASVDTEIKLQEALELPFPLIDCVQELAKDERVVVVFDQLDALSELVCLDPQRLIVLLKQVEKLARIENVHIVASARQFEADHDPHLRSLEASRVSLALPEWEQITPILDGRKISYDAWMDDVRALLRTPQYLKIFLDIQKTEPGSVFRTYLGLLNSLWRLRVEEPTGSRERVLEQLAQRMSKFEELTVPSIAFGSDRDHIDFLIRAHILQEDFVNGTLSFTHQTLFEYVRARTFLKGTESLSAYVVERQNSLFIRPQLWNALGYMRDGDVGQYRIEVSSLVSNTGLRFHLRLLIIEFLGQLATPRDYEMAWLLPFLSDEEMRPLILVSLVGSPGWFTKLTEVFLPTFMRSPKDKAKEAILLLRAAINFDKSAVLSLLEESWVRDREMDFLVLSVFESMSSWCSKTVNITAAIIERNNINPHYIDRLCMNACETSGKMAVELLLAQLKATLSRVRQIAPAISFETPEKEQPLLEDPGYLDLRRDYDCPRRKALIQLVDKDDYYVFDELVESDPEAFVEILWPWLVEVLTEIAHQGHEFIDKFPTDGSHTRIDDEDDVVRKYSIIGAMNDALLKFAESSPSAYCRFLERSKNAELQTVQRLLARALIPTVSVEPAVSFQFLIEDTRRLSLGSTSSEHHDSANLIKALYPYLNDEQCRILNTKLTGYSHYVQKPQNDDLETRFKRAKWDRKHRLELMRSIPDDLTPSEVARLREEEERAFPSHGRSDRRAFEVSWVGSPMTVEQMNRASIEQLLEMFRELNDATGDTHPKDFLKGGTRQLSQNLVELAKLDRDKVLKLLENFDPSSNEVAASYALRGLEVAGLEPEAQFELILGLDARGFRGNSFRGSVASLVDHHAESGVNVPDEMVDLLKRFLREHAGGYPDDLSAEQSRTDRRLLWSHDSHETFSESSTYTLVSALLEIYRRNDPPQWEEWLLLLEDLLKRTDLPDYCSTWRLVALTCLTNLRFVDHTRANKLLESLLKHRPSPLISRTGVFLFAHTHGWLGEELIRLWLEELHCSSWVDSRQAYGELLCLHHIWFPDRAWAKVLLTDLFANSETVENEDVLKGIAYTIGHLWASPGDRERKSELFLTLVDLTGGRLCDALCEGLSSDAFPVDEQTRRLLTKLVDDRKLLHAVGPYGLVENLQELVDWYPESIYKLCHAIIDEFGADIGDIRTKYAVISGSLMDLVMRLQHRSEPARSWGLELFERLLDLRIPDARAMLNVLDRRVDTAAKVAKPVRRTANRRSKKRRRT